MNQPEEMQDTLQSRIDHLEQQNRKLLERIADLENQALTDSLTGIANRRAFDLELDRTIAAHNRYDWNFCLMILDVDKFKYINDTYGHPVGDKVLRQMADRLRTLIRETDHFSRIGGDEFAIILNGVDIDRARVAGERIATTIAEQPFVNGRFSVSITLGISSARPGDCFESIIERADEELYKSKRRKSEQIESESSGS